MNVFASVGTQKFPFTRLLKLVDQAAAQGQPQDRFFAQTGFTDYQSPRIETKPFLPKEEFEERIKNCDLLIVHGGVGTMITALKYQKKIIVVPRLCKYGEHVDDHQMQIAESFEQKNLVLCCRDGDDILRLIEEAGHHSFAAYVSHRADMVRAIEGFLASLEP